MPMEAEREHVLFHMTVNELTPNNLYYLQWTSKFRNWPKPEQCPRQHNRTYTIMASQDLGFSWICLWVCNSWSIIIRCYWTATLSTSYSSLINFLNHWGSLEVSTSSSCQWTGWTGCLPTSYLNWKPTLQLHSWPNYIALWWAELVNPCQTSSWRLATALKNHKFWTIFPCGKSKEKSQLVNPSEKLLQRTIKFIV